MKNHSLITAGLLAAALACITAPAMARVDVDINLGFPGIYAEPQPVYVQPRPVYVQPRPVYVESRPVYMESYRHGRNWHGSRDQDHDGIPNYRDHDRDGDGVANLWDRRPNNPYRY